MSKVFLTLLYITLLIYSTWGQQTRPSPVCSILSDDEKRINISSELVNLAISVTDRDNRAVTGLKKENFIVTDNGRPQELTFFSDDDSPVSIGIVFDRSESMKGKKIDLARTALNKFIQTSRPDDEYFLIAFNEHAQLLLDHSLHGEELIKRLEHTEPSGNTSLYDAAYLGIDRVKDGIYKRKVLLIISDAQDNHSRYDAKDVLRFEKESGVMVFAVGILEGMFLRERRKSEYRLEDLTKSSGGLAFYPHDNSDMDETFEKIALEVRHIYSVGYIPASLKNDGSWHKVKVRLKKIPSPQTPTVRFRSGYYDISRR